MSNNDYSFLVALEKLTVPAMVANQSGLIEYVNMAWYEATGWLPADMIGKPYLSFVHPDDTGKTMDEHKALEVRGSTNDFQNRYRRKDGNYVTLTWISVPWSGEVTYALAIPTSTG